MFTGNLEQDSGDDVSGGYSGTFATTTTTTVQESSTHTGSSDAYTEVMTDTSSGPESGDSVTGSFTQSTSGGSTISTLQDSGNDAGGAYTVAEQDTGDYSSTKTGDSVSGTYTTTRTATDNYSMTETCSSYTVTETGTTQTTTTETGNSQTADYSRTITGTDNYTIGETGSTASGSYQESVWGSDTYTQTETGNSLNQTFSRQISGTETYTRSESGGGATLGSGSGSIGYTVQETGDSRAGVLSQSETGDDRYSLLESFDNVANAAGGSSPGHLDYSPVGLAFGDPPPKELELLVLPGRPGVIARSGTRKIIAEDKDDFLPNRQRWVYDDYGPYPGREGLTIGRTRTIVQTINPAWEHWALPLGKGLKLHSDEPAPPFYRNVVTQDQIYAAGGFFTESKLYKLHREDMNTQSQLAFYNNVLSMPLMRTGNELLDGNYGCALLYFGLDVVEVGPAIHVAVFPKVTGVGASAPTRASLLEELAQGRVKHTPENVIAIAKDASGKVVFLEKGGAKAGLQHIVQEHGAQFAQQGIAEAQIPDAVMAAVTRGKQVGMQGARPIFEVEFNGKTHRIAVDVSSNGFIVGANPTSLP